MVVDWNKLCEKYEAMKNKKSALSQNIKNKLLEDNKYLKGKYLQHKKLAHQFEVLEIKAKYEHQSKLQNLQEEHQKKLR